MRSTFHLLVFASAFFTIGLSEGQETQLEPPWETKTFDVGVGQVQILHSGEIPGLQIINCRFSIDDYRNTEDTFASVALMFTSSDAEKYDVEAHTVRLAAYRFEDDHGWRHEFTLTGPDDRDSRIVAHTGTTDTIPPMWLIKAEYPKVTYVVGHTDIDVSQVDVSDYPVVSWQIVAIGVKGESRCSFET
ncbi:MAG: hypothetical protein AAF351_11395 [Pseudomonadota bacterium]